LQPNVEFIEPEADADFDPFAGGAVARVGASSEGQREVWLADRQGIEASLAFNEAVELRLDGPLDVDALLAAVVAVAGRHESLRTTFSSDGCERLIADACAVACEWHPHVTLAAEQCERALAAARERAVSTPFDLEHGPLLRAELHRVGADAHVLLMSAHHIVCDGWSWGVLSFDLASEYARQRHGLATPPEPAVRYSDYVDWALEHKNSPEAQADERFWLERLAGPALPVLDLPADRPRPPVRRFGSRRVDHVLSSELVQGLRAFGRQLGVSEFATLLAGFSAMLSRVTAQADFIIGVPTAGQLVSGMAGLVGHCVNLLPLRVVLEPGGDFSAHARAASGVLLDALDHQAITYGTLLSKLPIQRDPGRLPLLSVMFNLDQADNRLPTAFTGLRAALAGVPRVAENFELFVNAVPADGGLRLECQYSTALFDAATVQGWMEVFETLLRAAVAQPQQPVSGLACVPASDLQGMQRWQGPNQPLPVPALMHSEIVRRCAQAAGRFALSMDDQRVSYAQLEAESNRLARALRARGVRRGDRVGLCLPRGPAMVLALLAVNKAGGAYVPLDPGFPAARLAYYAEDAQLALLVTQHDVSTAPRAWRPDAAERIFELDADPGRQALNTDPLPPGADDAQPEDAAYVIYTSGSTGKPKGVCVPHRAAANFLATMRARPGLGADDRLAAVTTLSFDIAVLELLLPLTVGAEVVIVPRETAMDGNALRSLLEQRQVTAMQGTPGIWRLLLDAGWHAREGFTALVGGESVPVDLADELMGQGAALWNMYGPTETTVWSTVWRVDAEALHARGMSIGQPIANTQVWVLDESRQLCPVGVPGEICIGGDGVALGYLDRPELTADRFITAATPTGPARLYRTGDRGRWRHDGLLEHLGRLDFQVKLRGYRIELGEVESACAGYAGVGQCVALIREDAPGDVRLVAYLVPAAGGPPIDTDGMRAQLRQQLPDYMIPQHLVQVEALPLLPNGKIDRRSLPAPTLVPAPAAAGAGLPGTALEEQVRVAMEQILKLPGIGLRDDFFSLGGHSLLAARLTSRLNRELGLSLTLRALFEAPTVQRLAAYIEAARARPEPAAGAAIAHQPGRRSAPLTPMQERIRFVEELYAGSVAYSTPSAHRLSGPFDADAFRRALMAVCQRQAALRTCISRGDDGIFRQQIIDAIELPLPMVDLSTLPMPQREASLHAHMEAMVDQPLRIERAPLCHAALYRMAEQEHVFLFVPHHIVWDGWSFDVFYQDISACYAAQTQPGAPALPPLAVSYGDYAQWYVDWLGSDDALRQQRYWKERFAGLGAPRAMPTDLPRQAGMVGDGAVAAVDIGHDLAEQVRQAARAAAVSVSSLAMAVAAMLIGGVSGSDRVVLGMPVRGRESAELEGVMGFFNNLLPMSIDVAPALRVAQVLGAVQLEMVGAMANQGIAFEVLSAQPEVAAVASASGLYQASFSFQDFRERTTSWGPLQHSRVDVAQRGVTEELGFWLGETGGGIVGAVTYKTSVFTAATAEALRDRFIELLAAVCARPQATVQDLLASNSAAATHLVALRGRSEAANALAAASQTQAWVDSRKVASAPLDARETRVAQIWAELLGIDRADIRASDSFFDLGGDSLLAMRAVEAVHAETGVRVDARRYIYENLGRIAAADSSPQAAAPSVAPASGLMGRVLSAFGRRSRP